jgi:lipopolysaccharide/colanic/teichoic acid biosynthesis glycosyltransferase
MYKSFIKRILDFIFVFLTLVALLPIFLIITILVLFKMGSPVFFVQSRPGLNNKIFKIYKFRTMAKKYDEKGNLLEDSERLSKFGSFLRSTSLDELPSLWNVLCGNMALVGPRPLLTEYLPLYSQKQVRRHEVRPGITGWAQVNGRNTISWSKKFELDIWYVENQSFILDMKILFLTLQKVIKRDGINHNNHVTMDKFKGNK